MAELAPWLQPTPGSNPNLAPWLQSKEPEVSVLEDVAKAAPVGLAQGVIGIPGAPGDLQELIKAGADKSGLSASDPFGWVTHKLDENFPSAMKFFRESNAKSANSPIAQVTSGDMPGGISLPSSRDIQGQVEKVTGPFYQAKTTPGKIAQTTAQVAPALLTGGESLVGTGAKALGAGLVSEGAGEAANNLKGYLPQSAQPWAEPVARAVGAGAGVFAPSMARRAITPLPVSDERSALLNVLKTDAPQTLKSASAGQVTDRPGLMGIEGRTNKFESGNQAGKQEEAFTKDTMSKMGIDGLATQPNIAKGQDIGKELGDFRRANEINPAEFPGLNTEIAKLARKHAGTVGKDDAAVIADIQKDIRMGASNNSNVASMPGARYDYMRQKIQTAIENAGTGTESKALSDVRTALDNAFHRSITKQESAHVKDLEKQYANYGAISNKNPTGRDTVTPDEMRSAASKQFGAKSVNEGNDPLSPFIDRSAKVMQEIPAPNREGGPITKVLGGVLGGIGGAGVGHFTGGGHVGMGSEGLLGAFYGQGHANDFVQALKDVTAKGVASTPAQAYLKNQMWRPGPNSSADAATIARLLMSPPVEQLTNQGR